MTTPSPPPAPGGGQAITVNKDNVLEVRKVILQAAASARDRLLDVQSGLRILPAAQDDISTTAAATWNANLVSNPDSHFNRLKQYVENVEALGKQLEDAAKQYGFTDDEIAASFQVQRNQT